MAKTFTTGKNVDLELRPVSQFKIDSLRASKKEFPVPTYTVKPVAGPEQELPLDEIVAENKGRLDEWKEYVAKRDAKEAEYAKRFSELLIWEGVGIEVPGPDSDWQKLNERFGIDTPADPIARKVFYVYNEFLVGPEDMGDLVAEIMSISQMKQEVVEKLRASFRLGARRKTNKPMAPAVKPVESQEPVVE